MRNLNIGGDRKQQEKPTNRNENADQLIVYPNSQIILLKIRSMKILLFLKDIKPLRLSNYLLKQDWKYLFKWQRPKNNQNTRKSSKNTAKSKNKKEKR